MRVVITGASGVLGGALVRALRDRGDEVVALTRGGSHGGGALERTEVHAWPRPKEEPPPEAALAGADAVVNLLGEPIAQRWTTSVKEEIRQSRVLGTRSLVAGLAALPDTERPRMLISQSATGYYGPCGDQPLTEDAAAGTGFLADVVVEWEHEAEAAAALPGMRVACTRTGVVFSPSGGALGKMLLPFRMGVGGPIAGGHQYVPWVHLDDVVGALLHCLDHAEAVGAVNLTAPNPVTNAALGRALGHVLHRPAVLPVPGLALRLLYGEMAMVVTSGQRVLPQRLLDTGYVFKYPEVEAALRSALGRS